MRPRTEVKSPFEYLLQNSCSTLTPIYIFESRLSHGGYLSAEDRDPHMFSCFIYS